jgi:hypothetical protein
VRRVLTDPSVKTSRPYWEEALRIALDSTASDEDFVKAQAQAAARGWHEQAEITKGQLLQVLVGPNSDREVARIEEILEEHKQLKALLTRGNNAD